MLPDVFKKVLSNDAKFETVSSNLAKPLLLRRQDNLVGHKRIIFAIDKANQSPEATNIRKVITDSFKNIIGFEDKEILFIDSNEFVYEDEGRCYRPNLSDATVKEMTDLGLPIFTDT